MHVDQWDAAEEVIDWPKTKNNRPHAIPVPAQAAELLNSIKPNKYGWFFPSANDPPAPVSHNTLYSFIKRQRERSVTQQSPIAICGAPWKTLAGKAGVTKEILDCIQNHALHDLSSKNCDRWNYMPEKRAGMKKWDKSITALLSKGQNRKAA